MARWPRASASMPSAPRCSSILRTTLLPVAILPVNPMTNLPGHALMVSPACMDCSFSNAECQTLTARVVSSLLTTLCQAWVKRIAHSISKQVESQHGQHDRKTRVEDQVWRSEDLITFSAKHCTPFRRRWLCAQTEKRKRSSVQDGSSDAKRDSDDQRGQ